MTKTINFYSTKRHGNVEIPVDKVCGTRITNSYMKKGYSDGVRAGLNNGVVNQKLSRFSTEADRIEATSNCEGNVNWLNHRKGENFKKAETGYSKYEIKRPSGKISDKSHQADSIDNINRRSGNGNREIKRPSFLAPPIKARLAGEFDKLQLLTLQEAGKNTNTLEENKLGYETSIQIPDPTDFEWLRARASKRAQLIQQFRQSGLPQTEILALMEKELMINPPLGRKQRTIASTTDDVARNTNLSTKNKLIKIISDVKDGRAETKQGQQNLTAQLVLILQDTTALETMSTLQLEGLGQSIARMGVPTSYKQLGLIPRIVDKFFYKDNAGMINLLLFSKVAELPKPIDSYNYNLIVKNFTAPQPKIAIKLTSLTAGMGTKDLSKRRYLDLERGGIVDADWIRNEYNLVPDPLTGLSSVAGNPEFSIAGDVV
jgi:hypothetical protein